MSAFVLICVSVPLTTLLAVLCGLAGQRRRLVTRTCGAWLVLVPLLMVVNHWWPFTAGGDDLSYFMIANPPVSGLAEVFDLSRFEGIEQPGYPWLLSNLNSIIGYDLAGFKLLNVAWLIVAALVWYRVGLNLEGPEFAIRLLTIVLLLTPLWHYVFFLLKDMSVVLLQSFFVLALVQLRASRVLMPALLVAGLAVPLALFRSPVILINGVVLCGTLLLGLLAVRKRRTGLATVGVVAVLMLSGASLFTDYVFMARLGLFEEHRVVSSAMIDSRLETPGGLDSMGLLFPIVYLLIDVAALNPESWTELNVEWLRAVLAIPWILLAPPFVVLGIGNCFVPSVQDGARLSRWQRIRSIRALSSPWGGVLLFVLASCAVSWTVGDTTRWRIADLPALAALGLLGWNSSRPPLRRRILAFWCACVVAYGLLVTAGAL